METCRPRTAAGGGRPQAGLEDVEKVLTDTVDAANKTAWTRSSPDEDRARAPVCSAVHPSAVGSIPDSVPNKRSIPWSGGDLARPGPGPADRSAAGPVRGAARRRLGHRPRGSRQGRALPPRGRHQDLEPHAA
jgi:hypothetical protein